MIQLIPRAPDKRDRKDGAWSPRRPARRSEKVGNGVEGRQPWWIKTKNADLEG